MAPDPSENIDRTISGSFVVGKADGTTETIAVDDFAAALADQNVIRAGLGLPPIPLPGDVTHAAPAK